MIELFSSPQEREAYETMADLYSIFLVTENLEKAYIRDAISADEYTAFCSKLIAQFKTCLHGLGSVFDINDFLYRYDVLCFYLGKVSCGKAQACRNWRSCND